MQHGEVIAIMHQYAYTGKGHSIHSSAQLEWFKNDVNDKSSKIPGGSQCIKTLDGYVLPLNICSGLPYLTMHPYTDNEWEALPHVILTSDVDWNPLALDHDLDDDEEWFDAVSDMQAGTTSTLFDEYGNYRKCYVVTEAAIHEPMLEQHLLPTDGMY